MAAQLRTWLYRHRFGILLLSLVSVPVVPVIRGLPDEERAGLLWVFVLLAAMHAVSGERKATWVFAAIGVLGFGGRIANMLGIAGSYEDPVDAASYIAFALFIGMMIYVVFHAVLAAPRINGDTVMGAISVYMMIGLLWTMFYALIYLNNPAAFNFPAHAAPSAGGIIPEYTFGYYSFVTLTTLGYGDVTPITFRARTMSWLEAVVGVTYMATVIAFLVSQVMVDKRSGES